MAALVTPEPPVLSRALSCAHGAGMCLRACMHEYMRACVKGRPLATSARVHMLVVFFLFFFLRPDVPWVTSDLADAQNQRAASFMEIRAVSSLTG